ncbi:hypothetical protein TRFO_22728 [Tritrichomonas foetus]|uniref:Uncharacterized protein n=1 Tax=Tritrichomonas foetus TaxID=1144522 RepID=A0A1J4KB50_9EUKA|nr:hypothetical protein TRFO_22728 [Tritrichomonas foetus]|eukprot:OHT08647.1 hypothetical protein TRFO_22728 [Tritrichomonas foetus]
MDYHLNDHSGMPTIDALKDHITCEDSKSYIQRQFNEIKQNANDDTKKKTPLRTLLAQKKMCLVNMATNKTQSSNSAIPIVPTISPQLNPISSQKADGIKRLDEVTQNIKRDLDDFDQMTATFAENLIALEAQAIECKQLAELSRVLSDSSLQQLDQIHKLHGSNTFFHSTVNFIKSFIPNQKLE